MATKRRPPRAQAGRSRRAAPKPIPSDPGTEGTKVEHRLDRKLARDGYYFDQAAANHICDFFEMFVVHTEGELAGTLIRLEAWQRRHLRRLFGWKRPDGTRRYRRTFWFLPRKNGKSLIASGIALYLLMFDTEMGPQVFCAAANKEQARLVFNAATSTAKASPELHSRLYITKASIFHPESAGAIKALSGLPDGKHGLNIHGAIFDELHEWRKRDLYNALTTGSVARRQSLEFTITTAGDERSKLCIANYKYACLVRDGDVEDPEFLPVIYEAGEDDDWTDEETWHRANPNLGVGIKIDRLRAAFAKAQIDTAEAVVFRRYHLNIWENSVQRWLPAPAWKKCNAKPRGLGDPDRVWYAGLDLSKTTDLSALVLCSLDADGVLDIVPFFWVPDEAAAERARRDLVPYLQWIKSGHIVATPGAVVDYDFIERKIIDLNEQHSVVEIDYDRQYANQLAQRVESHGVTVVECGQGYLSLAAPTAEFERLVRAGKVRHGDHPVLNWMAGNAVVEVDAAGNMKPTKAKSTERIDGIVAAIMGLRRCMAAGGGSVYEQDGITLI